MFTDTFVFLSFDMFDSFFVYDCKACVCSLSGFSSAEVSVYVSVCMLGRVWSKQCIDYCCV